MHHTSNIFLHNSEHHTSNLFLHNSEQGGGWVGGSKNPLIGNSLAIEPDPFKLTIMFPIYIHGRCENRPILEVKCIKTSDWTD